jgi:multisubunit Na+/H+ antiporter MnhC subunit
MMGSWLSSLRREGATHPVLKVLVVASIVIAAAALLLILVPVIPLARAAAEIGTATES